MAPNGLIVWAIPCHIENSLLGKKELLVPLRGKNWHVRVDRQYSNVHLGNARTFTHSISSSDTSHTWDIKSVIRNITDAGHLENDGDEGEDKIVEKARRARTMEIVHTVDFHKIMQQLNALPPSIEPTARDT